MVFDQREFRMPSEKHREMFAFSTDLEPYRYHDLFENWYARLDYLRSIGASVAGDDETPLFMLEGADAEKVWADVYEVQGGHVLKLTNPTEETLTVTLHLSDYHARTAFLNPVNGKTLVLRQEEDGAYRIALPPKQEQMRVLCFGEFARTLVFDGFHAPPAPRKEVAKLDGEWRGERIDPNALVHTSTDNWTCFDAPDGNSSTLRIVETIEDIPAKCKLAAIDLEGYAAATVNKKPIAISTNEYRANLVQLRTADITALLTTGENEIETVITKDGLADYLLMGDFAVNRSRASLIKENATFTIGDLVEQGYPYYAGTFALETSVDLPNLTRGSRYLLTFPTFDTIVLHVIVNGALFEPIITQPWETDISAALRPGRNTIRIELTNGFSNQYDDKLKPFGLLAPPVIVEEEWVPSR
ncbi:MAG: hypothetical protein FWG50_02375 [Kiritimatiellaeota bacterium]|nr:hypothetical protein [Kiritimatiellota bacterium]